MLRLLPLGPDRVGTGSTHRQPPAAVITQNARGKREKGDVARLDFINHTTAQITPLQLMAARPPRSLRGACVFGWGLSRGKPLISHPGASMGPGKAILIEIETMAAVTSILCPILSELTALTLLFVLHRLCNCNKTSRTEKPTTKTPGWSARRGTKHKLFVTKKPAQHAGGLLPPATRRATCLRPAV